MRRNPQIVHKNPQFPHFAYDKPIVIVYYNIHTKFCQQKFLFCACIPIVTVS